MWGVVLLCDHLVLMWAWAVVKLLQSVDHHSGYEHPALVLINPMRLLPYYAGTDCTCEALWWVWGIQGTRVPDLEKLPPPPTNPPTHPPEAQTRDRGQFPPPPAPAPIHGVTLCSITA